MSKEIGEGGSEGQVFHEKYCMKDNIQAKTCAEMNSMSGYEDMSDLANTKEYPVSMVAATRNEQEGPKMANPRHNDRS
jgi:hypothetical protein